MLPYPTANDALMERIKRAARYGDIVVDDEHIQERMVLRTARYKDIKNAIVTATDMVERDNGRIRTEGGVDREGDALRVVLVEYPGGIIVVTILDEGHRQ